MPEITERGLREILDSRFGGVLRAGWHNECDGRACARELVSVAMGIPWTDGDSTRSWDYRPLNDIRVSSAVRAECMIPVIAAYAGSLDWEEDRQVAVASRLAVLTVNRVIAGLSGLPAEVALACREAITLADAGKAARAAADAIEASASAQASARAAAWAVEAAETEAEADAAAYAAEAASDAAASAATQAARAARAARAAPTAKSVFLAACQLWLDAAK